MSNFRTSSAQVQRIKDIERFSPKAIYDDNKSTPDRIEYAIGYGHQIQPHEDHLINMTVTEQWATDTLKRDLAETFEPPVNKFITWKGATQNQFDALIDLSYNCGPGVLGDNVAKMIKKYYSGDKTITPAQIADQWAKTRVTWEGKVQDSLIERRQKQAQIFFYTK
jgi:GH24 family phage-related lysozyme (muramidase)